MNVLHTIRSMYFAASQDSYRKKKRSYRFFLVSVEMQFYSSCGRLVFFLSSFHIYCFFFYLFFFFFLDFFFFHFIRFWQLFDAPDSSILSLCVCSFTFFNTTIVRKRGRIALLGHATEPGPLQRAVIC